MNSAHESSAAGPSKFPASVPTRRLACAISPEEKKLFLGPAAGVSGWPDIATVWLEHSGHGLSVQQWMDLNPAILLTGWSTVPLPAEWLDDRTCALRYVCHLTGSVRRLLPRTFIAQGGVVTNWGDIPSTAVAEHALLLALAALRNLGGWTDAAPHPRDTARRIERLKTRSLVGRNVGIHGFGRIARALVSLLRPFGVSITAFSAGVPAGMLQAAGVASCASLGELFARSEVLFECEALTPATAGSVSAGVLARLPDAAVFVNVARGGLVDEAALLAETGTGRVRVALDVVTSEPLAPEGPFATVTGAVLSPHIGGPTFDQYPQCGGLALRNIARFVKGEPLEAVVTPADYDRAT